MHLILLYPLLKGWNILIFLQRSTVGSPQHHLINLLPYYDHVRSFTSLFFTVFDFSSHNRWELLIFLYYVPSLVKTFTLINF